MTRFVEFSSTHIAETVVEKVSMAPLSATLKPTRVLDIILPSPLALVWQNRVATAWLF